MKQFRYIAPGMLLVLIASPLVQARDFSARVSVVSAESDNAFKSTEDTIDERQDAYVLSLTGNYANDFLTTEVNYTGSDERFAKASQEERRFLEGRSMLLLGALTDPADIEFKHSRTSLLSTPDAINLSNNQDERESLSVIPRLKKRVTAADLLIASVDYTQIHFLKNDLNDSERSSAQFNWVHQSTQVSELNFLVQRTDIGFDNFPDADYVYSSAVATYSTQLRKLSYTLAAGYNRSEPSTGDTYGSPTYALSVAFKDPLNSLQLMLAQSITDSSMENGNLAFVSPIIDGESTYKVDQIKRRNASLSWGSNFICDKCSLSVSVHRGVDDYVVLPDEINIQGASVAFTYNLSKRSAVSLRSSSSEQEFVGELLGRDYTIDRTTLDYRYDFDGGFSLRFFAEQEERGSENNATTYQETLLGGELTWTIF